MITRVYASSVVEINCLSWLVKRVSEYLSSGSSKSFFTCSLRSADQLKGEGDQDEGGVWGDEAWERGEKRLGKILANKRSKNHLELLVWWGLWVWAKRGYHPWGSKSW